MAAKKRKLAPTTPIIVRDPMGFVVPETITDKPRATIAVDSGFNVVTTTAVTEITRVKEIVNEIKKSKQLTPKGIADAIVAVTMDSARAFIKAFSTPSRWFISRLQEIVPDPIDGPFPIAEVKVSDDEIAQVRSLILTDEHPQQLASDAIKLADRTLAVAIDTSRSTIMRHRMRDRLGLAADRAYLAWRRSVRLTFAESEDLAAVLSVADHLRFNLRTCELFVEGLVRPGSPAHGEINQLFEKALQPLDDAIARVTPADGPRLVAS